MEWTPGDPGWFITDCSGTFGMAGWNARKVTMGPATWLELSWTTIVNMYYGQINSPTPSLNASFNTGGDKSHIKEYLSFDFSKAATYQWRTRNQNRCLDWCGYSAYKYFTINRSGVISAQW